MTDREILLLIQGLLTGTEWNSDTLDEIALILHTHGYPVRDLDTSKSNVIAFGYPSDNDK